MVVKLVTKFGTKKWSFVGGQLKGRTGKQCRERYTTPTGSSPSLIAVPHSPPCSRPSPKTHRRTHSHWIHSLLATA